MLLFSQGTPMLCGGDEICRTQHGNNNAYCQDNEISWLNWNLNEESRQMLEFTSKVISIRREHPALHRTKFFQGRQIRGSNVRDIIWFRPDGGEMDDEDWTSPNTRGLIMFLSGTGIDDVDENGIPLHDNNFLLMLNASARDADFYLPRIEAQWELLIDTANPGKKETGHSGIRARSLKLFRCCQPVVPPVAPA